MKPDLDTMTARLQQLHEQMTRLAREHDTSGTPVTHAQLAELNAAIGHTMLLCMMVAARPHMGFFGRIALGKRAEGTVRTIMTRLLAAVGP